MAMMPPKWVSFEESSHAPIACDGYEYTLVKRCSCCGSLACLVCWPIEIMSNLLICFDNSPEGEAFDMMCPKWWKLVKSSTPPI